LLSAAAAIAQHIVKGHGKTTLQTIAEFEHPFAVLPLRFFLP
jgi:hypothetical protein